MINNIELIVVKRQLLIGIINLLSAQRWVFGEFSGDSTDSNVISNSYKHLIFFVSESHFAGQLTQSFIHRNV
jgi:hypothetical protein